MENTDISQYVYFEVVKEKSLKGNEYKALYLCVRDNKTKEIIYRYLITFLNNSRYDDLLSLISK